MPTLPFLQGCPASPTTPLGAGGVGAVFTTGAGVGGFKQQTLSGPPLHWPLTVEVLHSEGLPQMPGVSFLQIWPGSPVIPSWSSLPSAPLSPVVFEFQTAASALRRWSSPAVTFEPGLMYNNRAAGTLGQLAVFERAVEIVLKASFVVL